MGLARIYPYTKLEVSSFTRFRFTEGGLKFNFWSLDPDYALFGGYFVMLEMELATFYPCTEFEVSSFTVPDLRKRGLEFKNSAPEP